MTVDCKIILQINCLIRCKKFSLDFQQILGNCQGSALRKLQVISIISICISITINNDLCQIRLVAVFQKHLAVNRQNTAKGCFSLFSKLCIIISKKNAGIQCQCSCLGINIYIQVILGKFLLQGLNNLCLYTDDIIDLGLLGADQLGFLIQIHLLLCQGCFLFLKLLCLLCQLLCQGRQLLILCLQLCILIVQGILLCSDLSNIIGLHLILLLLLFNTLVITLLCLEKGYAHNQYEEKQYTTHHIGIGAPDIKASIL